ncbi:MAG: AraC family transcriptional regulator [Acetobacteraceae bacterium]|nr:AraC family transcriptional regulator [Acetobacteraceae bacterium]
MALSVDFPDARDLAAFHVTRSSDPAEFDSRSRVSDRLPGSSREYRYRLQDRTVLRQRFEAPIFSVAIRTAGPLLVSLGESRFASEVSMDGNRSDVFGFSTPLRGDMTLIRREEQTAASPARGLAYRLGPDTRLVTSDDSLRTNVFVKVAQVEEALEQALDRHLPAPLELSPALDWSKGLAASLKAQLDFLLREFGRTDGLAGNAIGLAAATDLLVTLILRGIPHNYAAQLEPGAGVAVPAYVHRAEEFMRAHAAEAIRIADIAAAAGCSVRTLSAVFRHFRDRSPLAALHGIRLEQVHAELSRGASDTPIGAIARRYGFTNGSRFLAAFQVRFGETPSQVRGRGSRGPRRG